MTTGAIIAIVVVVILVLFALALVMPRMRAQARVQRRERDLAERRERAAGEHRMAATEREREADLAEQRARVAAREAEAERAQAELHSERAGLTERGMADHELIDEDERDRFAGTSADRSLTDAGQDSDGPTRFRREDVERESDRPARY